MPLRWPVCFNLIFQIGCILMFWTLGKIEKKGTKVAKRKPNRSPSLRPPADVSKPYTTEVMSYFRCTFPNNSISIFRSFGRNRKRNKVAKMAPGNSSLRSLVWILVSTQAEHYALGRVCTFGWLNQIFLYQCFLMDTVFNTGACPAPRCHCQVPTEAHALLQATYCWVQFKRLHLFYYYFDLFKPIYNFISPSQPNILFLENQPNILSYPFG
jgi:hypothetical protein